MNFISAMQNVMLMDMINQIKPNLTDMIIDWSHF